MTVFFHFSLYGFANVYLVGNDETGEAMIVDPAAFTIGLLNFIERRGYDIKAALITHNHAHHVAGLGTLLKIYDAKVYSANAEIGGRPCVIMHDGDEFECCGLPIQAISVPGHSADSIVYKIEKLLFTGDSLYCGHIGSTASQYSHRLLKEQLGAKILNQAEDCLVLPAHGPPSTVGAEKRFNLGFKKTQKEAMRARYEFFV